ncbi:MATE efflux family protein 5 [Triticum urartu]|uniref:Protein DETOXIFICATION n=1 Tax=Triticum urartu TaxID=4572 RepID=M7ZE93_TRIUA|nr:MATE efflux family protein 5 [Triticum urartu]
MAWRARKSVCTCSPHDLPSEKGENARTCLPGHPARRLRRPSPLDAAAAGAGGGGGARLAEGRGQRRPAVAVHLCGDAQRQTHTDVAGGVGRRDAAALARADQMWQAFGGMLRIHGKRQRIWGRSGLTGEHSGYDLGRSAILDSNTLGRSRGILFGSDLDLTGILPGSDSTLYPVHVRRPTEVEKVIVIAIGGLSWWRGVFVAMKNGGTGFRRLGVIDIFAILIYSLCRKMYSIVDHTEIDQDLANSLSRGPASTTFFGMEGAPVTSSSIVRHGAAGAVAVNLLLLATSEAKRQLRLAGPLIVGCLLQSVIQMISVMFVGHLGELALASASMASSFAIVTGFSFLVLHLLAVLFTIRTKFSNLAQLRTSARAWQTGMSFALDTICGQAFGANQDDMLGVYKQRAMLVLALASVPIAAVWANTGAILLHLGQDPEIAAGAGTYIRWMIPALFFYGWLQCHVRFLQAHKLVLPVMLSSGATAVSHVVVCWALVYRLRLGMRGAALANAVSYFTNVSILAVYVRVSLSCKKSWTGFSLEALHGLFPFLKLAVPSALMVCMEWWSFEVMVIISGLLPNPKLETAVLSICLNTNSLVCTVPNGLSSAISTRVSNELGARRPRAALLAARVVILLAFLVGTSEGLLLVLVHKVWGYAYSKDQEVVSYVASMMLILAISVLFDGLQYVLSGIIRGCGQQKIGALVNFTAYYLVGIPAALVFTFKCHLRGKGLWLGILSGLVTQTLLLLVISFGTTNWDKEVLFI